MSRWLCNLLQTILRAEMALAHAILASLLERPGTGSSLAGRFERSIGYFWTATHQQIYRELGVMTRRRWVGCRTRRGQAGPDEKHYRVLTAGRAELERWIAQPTAPRPLREDILVKVRAGASVPAPGLVAELRSQRGHHLRRLRQYRGIAARDFASPGALSVEARHLYLALRAGIVYEHAWLTWCDEALALLTAPARAGGGRSRR